MNIRKYYKYVMRERDRHYIYCQGFKLKRGTMVWCYMRRIETGEIEWEGWVRV